MDETQPPEPADHEYSGGRPEPFQARRKSRSPLRLVPIVGDLRSYSRRLLRADLVAGVSSRLRSRPRSRPRSRLFGGVRLRGRCQINHQDVF